MRERGSSGGGGRFGYDWFPGDVDGEARADAWAKKPCAWRWSTCVRRAAAPAGTLPVVLGAGWPGVLLHAAASVTAPEGDFNRRGTSVFSGQMGQLVSSELCVPWWMMAPCSTVAARFHIDDEGVRRVGYNVLIENGVLKGYMQDKLNARLMGVAPTGNGRRESYAHLPMPRDQYFTCCRAGPRRRGDVSNPLITVSLRQNFGGGQVDITSRQICLLPPEAYLD